MASPLRLHSVADLLFENSCFYIPNYQRGYCWETEQVTELLEDLHEWGKKKERKQGDFYCLQSLVVQQEKDREGEWEVIDGQQRLTTIFLILNYLKQTPGFSQTSNFKLHYERHSDPNGLAGLLESSPKKKDGDSPDLYFIEEARKTIEKWFAEKPEATQTLHSLLTSKDSLCAKFIWRELQIEDASEDAIAVFQRLNSGKIPLTEAELIRALFLKNYGSDKEITRHHISLRWDHMERKLRNKEFWGFLGGDEKIVRECPDAEACRITFVLKLVAEKGAEKIKDKKSAHSLFNYFSDRLSSCDNDTKNIWEEIEDCFCILEYWFQDTPLYHSIGLLVSCGDSLLEIYKASFGKRKKEFAQYVKNKIRAKIFDSEKDVSKIEEQIKGISYEDKTKEKIRRILLCFNIATLEADKRITVRFSFCSYTQIKWDIEHIRATNEQEPKGKDLETILESILKCVNDDRKSAIREELNAPTKEEGISPYAKLIREIDGEPAQESNSLGNLALLDSHTNRSYGAAPFAVKRYDILASERYVLPCTHAVFTKAYSSKPQNLLQWTSEDASAYIEKIQKTICGFLALKE